MYNVYRQKQHVSCMYVFGENTLRQSKANTKQWPRKSEDRTDTRDQDDRKESVARDENITQRPYDGAEDTGVNYVGKHQQPS